jgi:hypothetical protein
MKLKNTVWVNADRSKAVPAGHEDAAFLLAGAGSIVTDEVAKKYGLTEHGAKDQGKEKTAVLFPAGVTKSTPDGVNTAPDSPQAQGLRFATGTETEDEATGKKSAKVESVTVPEKEPATVTSKPSAIGLAPAKKRG